VPLRSTPWLRDVVHRRRIVEAHHDGATRPMLAARMLSWDVRTSIHVPVVHGAEVVGALSLYETRRRRPLSDEDRRLLALVGPSLGAALHGSRLLRAETERNCQLDSLLETIRAMTSKATLADVLDVVAVQAAAAFSVPSCAIFEYDEPADQLILRATYDSMPPIAAQDDLGTTYLLDDYPADRRLLHSGEIMEQLLSEPHIDPVTRRTMEKHGERSCLSVPLAFKGRVEGLLEIIETRWERRFTPAERDLASGIGEQAAAAIVNSRLYRKLQEATDQLENQLQVRHTLLELSEALLTLRDRAAVFEAIAGVLSTIVHYENMDISLIDRETDELVEVFEGDGGINTTLGLRLPLGVGACGSVIEAGRPEMVNDMLRDPRAVQVPGTDEEEQATLIIPLQVGAEIFGVLAVSRFGGRTFTEREFQLAQLVTNLAAIAIQNARLYDALQDKAIHDGLTGLYNHRYFYERLAQEVARSRRYEGSLALLMIDIDDFKRFNDAHGHLVGDRALLQLAACLTAEVREDVDIVARYGGEEFAVLLPNTTCRATGDGGHEPERGARPAADEAPCAAQTVAARIRARVAAETFGEEAGEHRGPLSVSIGVATLPDVAYDEHGLIDCADKALYLAKRLGKDRVEVYEA
jgi:GAF domain-containing protein